VCVFCFLFINYDQLVTLCLVISTSAVSCLERVDVIVFKLGIEVRWFGGYKFTRLLGLAYSNTAWARTPEFISYSLKQAADELRK